MKHRARIFMFWPKADLIRIKVKNEAKNVKSQNCPRDRALGSQGIFVILHVTVLRLI